MRSVSDDLIDRDLAVLWHPCSQMRDYQEAPPLPVVGAEGIWIELADGRRLADGICSWWCTALGHAHPHLVAALREQAGRFDQIILSGTTHEPAVRLCERLLALANGAPPERWGPGAEPGKTPGRYGRVFLADNGSTGMEIAIKLALHAQQHRGRAQRTRFAALQNGYHGETIATLALGDCGIYGDPYRSCFFDVAKLGPLPERNGPDDGAWLDAAAEWPAIEAQLAPLADELAAIVYEPVLQGAGGMRLYSPDLLTRLRRWADAHGVYLIADEIAAGMGRCGTMLASQLAPANGAADLCVLSKGLTGGMLPLSAVLCSDELYELFLADYTERKAFMHSNTYTGNALACAVGNAALDVFAADAICEQVAERGPLLRAGLAEIARDRRYLGPVRGVGMMAAVDLRRADGGELDWRERTGWQVYRACLEHGVLLRNLGDCMYLFPPLNSTVDEIEHLLRALTAGLDAVYGDG